MANGIVGDPPVLPRGVDVRVTRETELRDEVLDHTKEVRAVVVMMLREKVEAAGAARAPRTPRHERHLAARCLHLDAEAVGRRLGQLRVVRRDEGAGAARATRAVTAWTR